MSEVSLGQYGTCGQGESEPERGGRDGPEGWGEKLDPGVLGTDEEAVHLERAREQLLGVGSFSLHVGSGCQTGHQAW